MIRALLLCFAALLAMPAAAADGRALVVAGTVTLERASPGAFASTTIAAGAEIRRGDLVRTGSDGRVQIRFSDGGIVSLQPGTTFRIDEYRFEQGQQRAFFYLLRGALRTITGAIGKTHHDDYRMKTPTATVGVRGTEYVAEQTICDPRCSPGVRPGLRVAVTQGRIVVLTNAGELEVGAGQAGAAEGSDAVPRNTERGPVLPPISHSTPREPASGPAPVATATATGDESNAKGGQATNPLGTGVVSPSESRTPTAAVSPNEARTPTGALLPVAERIESSGDGAARPGDSGAGAPDGELEPGPPDDDAPGAPPPLAAGTAPIGEAAGGSGLTLRLLEPWRLGIDRAVRTGSLTLDDASRLSAFEWCGSDPSCRISRGNTKVEDAGSDAFTSWGRWTAGNARNGALEALHVAGNEGMHYLVGIPSTTIPTSGVFAYELVGATRATLAGGGPTASFDGRAAVAFSPAGARVGLDASVIFPSTVYSFTTPGGAADPTRSPLLTGPGHAFSGHLPVTGTRTNPVDCSAGCAVDLDGGLFGPEAARLGITYRITGSGRSPTITGVGVFGKKNPPE